jgi:hypothetical protein
MLKVVTEGAKPDAPNYPSWLVERAICLLPPSVIPELYDFILD